MGLDLVELILEVEETFGIKIADEEYEQIKTVGDFRDLIVRKCGRAHEAPIEMGGRNERTTCLSLVAFVKLRGALTTLFNAPRNLVRPKTALDDVIPVEFRRARWTDLEQALDHARQNHLGTALNSSRRDNS